MKILNPGAIANWWIGKQKKCQKCLAIVEFEAGDKVSEYRDDGLIKIMFACPSCGHEEVLYF